MILSNRNRIVLSTEIESRAAAQSCYMVSMGVCEAKNPVPRVQANRSPFAETASAFDAKLARRTRNPVPSPSNALVPSTSSATLRLSVVYLRVSLRRKAGQKREPVGQCQVLRRSPEEEVVRYGSSHEFEHLSERVKAYISFS